ncbi:hypothetical protein N0V83_010927 [Neocucurbitaria cava]|uniref:Allantoate permease n=1 Tax=Neocucurbitaria cava TaxID=798079 RepID=A0A9W8XY66_9PLEO|nr:hypothetical protein N0V83_010927 [Neocucurbitaria cava]
MDSSKPTDVAATQVPHEATDQLDIDEGEKALAKRVLRKIDWRLIPLMFITYNLNFMDKTILSSASVFGLREDTVCTHFTPYTRDEIPKRIGIWFAGNSVGGLVASFLAFGLGHISDSLAPWKWMYIVLGILTFIWGIPLLFFLPDSIAGAKFLTEKERKYAADRVVIAGTGRTANAGWKLDQAVECLMDPKTWIIFSMSLLTQIPNGGTQNFGNLVLKSFGFTSLESTLLTIPASVISAGTIVGTGWIAGRYRQLNCILIICVVTPAIVGSSLIYVRPRTSSGVQLFGYFLLSTGPGGIPLLLSLVGANYKGVTKKMTMTALLFIAYCAGNIAGPQFFRTKDAPHYNMAFRAILICYSLVVGMAVVLRFYLQWMNTKREREEGVKGSAGAGGVVAGGKMVDEADQRNLSSRVGEIELIAEDYDDVTDWKTFGFRYRL